MKIKTYLLLIIIPLGYLNAQGWETPIIDGYGEVKYFEKVDFGKYLSLRLEMLEGVSSYWIVIIHWVMFDQHWLVEWLSESDK